MQANCSEETPETLVLLSGGIDSAACLAFAVGVGRPTSALFVAYQQAAEQIESEAATRVARHFGVPLVHSIWKGASHKSTGEIRGRNALLLSAALVEAPESATAIMIGLHSGTEYPDCSASFVKAMQRAYEESCDPCPAVVAPFLKWSKVEVWEFARSKGVPLDLTYSCEAGTTPACGCCLSCKDRNALDV